MYLMKMTSLPSEVFEQLMKGEHVMRHNTGLWNSIWSDMFIEQTVMRYGHGPAGMVGITLNEKAVQEWALSLHISSQFEKDLFNLRENSRHNHVTYHKEEGTGRILSDKCDRENP